MSTGDFVGGAKLAAQNWNDDYVTKISPRKVLFWCKPQLKTYLERHGLSGIHSTTAAGFASHARFFSVYSDCLRGIVSDRQLELYSVGWLDTTLPASKRVLRAAVESEIYSRQLSQQGLLYEAMFCHLAAVRTLLHASYCPSTDDELIILEQQYRLAVEKLKAIGTDFVAQIIIQWQTAGRNLVAAGFDGMFTYLVHMCRILEVAGLTFLISKDASQQEELMDFVIDLCTNEPGAGKIPSDRYAVSLVFPILMAKHQGRDEFAKSLIRKSAEWLLDRFQNGNSIADYDANQYEEVNTLLGTSIPNLAISSGGGLLRMVLTDLSALIDDADFYSEICSILAQTVFSSYWQVQDSIGLTVVEGDDIIQYPNLRVARTFTTFTDYAYAEHVRDDPKHLSIVDRFDSNSLLILMILLRDRYFPTHWLEILDGATESSPVKPD